MQVSQETQRDIVARSQGRRLTSAEPEEPEEPDPIAFIPYTDPSDEYLALYQASDYERMADMIIESELRNPASMLRRRVESNREVVARTIIEILMASPKPVVTASVNGTLLQQVLQIDSEAQRAVALLQEDGEVPIIYANFLAGVDGGSLIASQVMEISGDLRRYAQDNPSEEDNEWALKIDLLINPPALWEQHFNLQG